MEDDSDDDDSDKKPKKRENICKTSNEEFFSDLQRVQLKGILHSGDASIGWELPANLQLCPSDMYYEQQTKRIWDWPVELCGKYSDLLA